MKRLTNPAVHPAHTLKPIEKRAMMERFSARIGSLDARINGTDMAIKGYFASKFPGTMEGENFLFLGGSKMPAKTIDFQSIGVIVPKEGGKTNPIPSTIGIVRKTNGERKIAEAQLSPEQEDLKKNKGIESQRKEIVNMTMAQIKLQP